MKVDKVLIIGMYSVGKGPGKGRGKRCSRTAESSHTCPRVLVPDKVIWISLKVKI